MPESWAQGLEEAIAAEVATHSTDTTVERELLATQRQRNEAERFKLMEAYYSGAIDVAMLRQEQDRISTELRAIESRQSALDATLDDWHAVMKTALRFATRCGRGYRRAGDRTRRGGFKGSLQRLGE